MIIIKRVEHVLEKIRITTLWHGLEGVACNEFTAVYESS
jgi:hypothetical protein